jgi:hypothetical protein
MTVRTTSSEKERVSSKTNVTKTIMSVILKEQEEERTLESEADAESRSER